MRNKDRPRIVVLGGGFAGLAAARQLPARRFDVTLVDRSRWFEFLPNIHELLSGVKSPELLRIPLERAAARLGHRFLRDTVLAIEPEQQKVVTRTRKALRYDALIVALGGVNATYGVPGADQHALPFKSVAQCARIGSRLAKLAGRRKGGRVVIVGGGLEGVEALGEVLRRHRSSPQLKVTIVEGRSHLLADAPVALHEHLLSLCKTWDVGLELGRRVARVAPDRVELEEGGRVGADLTIWTGGPAPSPLLSSAGLAEPDAWAPVAATLQSPVHPDVFVAGDASALGEPLPKQAYHALDMGVRAADNAARHLGGKRLQPFKASPKPTLISFGDLSCFLVAGDWVVAGAALGAGKEAIFEQVMGQLDDAPWWVRWPRSLERADRAARRLLWPTVTSIDALRRQARVSILATG